MREIIESGKFVSVVFVKENGEIRKLNGRTGVKKYIKGEYTRSEKAKKDYFLLSIRNGSKAFDQYRNIRKDRILEIKADGIVIYKNNNSQYGHFIY